MNKYLFLYREISRGQSVLRAFLNYRLCTETLVGSVIDIGGGGSDQYISFMKKQKDIKFKTFDVKVGDTIDFETDSLPIKNESFDTVLFLNVMEHIYNHQHIANEVVRITKVDGKLLGFVPFLMWYHPDHRDFFRYTHEALEKIFTDTHAKDIQIEPISMGPFIAATHIMLLSFPRIVRPVIFTFNYLLDIVYLTFRPTNVGKYPLGYFFTVKK